MEEFDFTTIRFQYYPSDIETKTPLGVLTLKQFILSIKNPKPEIISLFEQIAAAGAAGDKKLKDALKAKLFYCTPCVVSNGEGRKYTDIVSWNPILILDFDNLEPEYAVVFKHWLFRTYKFIVCCYLSPSKKGVKALVRIPCSDSVDMFKSYYYGLMDEFQYFEGIDTTGKNCMLPLYISTDPDILYRKSPEEFSEKGTMLDEFMPYEGEIVPLDDVTENDIKEIRNTLRRMMSRIVDSGHQIVRSTSLLAGGFCAAGYVDHQTMLDFMYSLIDSTPYLQAKPRTYKTTCQQMLIKGEQSPVYLKRHEK